MMRNKAKSAIDEVARGARKATDTVANAADANKRPSTRAKTKAKAAVDRAGDKVKKAGRTVKAAARRTKARAKARTY